MIWNQKKKKLQISYSNTENSNSEELPLNFEDE